MGLETIEPHGLFDQDDQGEQTDRQIAWIEPANRQDVQRFLMLQQDGSGETRSDWFWMRLRDGTLLFGSFPQGDAYLEFSDAGICDWQENS